jgi:cell division protein FtsA
MPRLSDPLVALEIGTTKVRALVAQSRGDDHLMVVGLGECPSRGVRKSEIVDLENAMACVRLALQSAEENSDVSIRDVFLLVSGGHIQAVVNRGSIPLVGEPSTITRNDVENVMESARALSLPTDRVVLHTICQHFSVDGQPGMINPVGLEGSRLDVSMLIIHGIRSRLKNTARVARSVPVDVQDVAFGGLCAALAVLSPEDKERGSMVIDLGGGTTSYIVYAGSTIAAAGCIAVGGDHVTNDIARGLRISLPDAEAVKEAHGSALIDLAARAQKIELAGDAMVNKRYLRLGDLQLISSLRAEETLQLVRSHLEPTGLLPHLGAGVVLTGGGAYLRRMPQLAEKVFGLPCQLGKPRDVSGLAVATSGPEFAAPLGMLRYAARTGLRQEAATWSIGRVIKDFLGLGS